MGSRSQPSRCRGLSLSSEVSLTSHLPGSFLTPMWPEPQLNCVWEQGAYLASYPRWMGGHHGHRPSEARTQTSRAVPSSKLKGTARTKDRFRAQLCSGEGTSRELRELRRSSMQGLRSGRGGGQTVREDEPCDLGHRLRSGGGLCPCPSLIDTWADWPM